jgi:hypothetical protein
MRALVVTFAAVLCCLFIPVRAAHQNHTSETGSVAIDALLARVAAYLDLYEQSVPAIVAEEKYVQRAFVEGRLGIDARTLRSDLLVIADENYGWISFRDVFEVDGRQVRDRDQRLANLFLKPHSDRHAQALRIVAEGARFNLNVPGFDLRRTVNTPLVALRFVRRPEQSRSRFRIVGGARVDGLPVTVLDFEEQATPRMIASSDGAAARGRFWVERESGRIRRSELSFETIVVGQKSVARIRARVRVSYARDGRVDEWVPATMEEEYRVGAALIEGLARYSNFRRFTVETRTDIRRDR